MSRKCVNFYEKPKGSRKWLDLLRPRETFNVPPIFSQKRKHSRKPCSSWKENMINIQGTEKAESVVTEAEHKL